MNDMTLSAEMRLGQATFSKAAAGLVCALDTRIVMEFFMRDHPIQKINVALFLK